MGAKTTRAAAMAKQQRVAMLACSAAGVKMVVKWSDPLLLHFSWVGQILTCLALEPTLQTASRYSWTVVNRIPAVDFLGKLRITSYFTIMKHTAASIAAVSSSRVKAPCL